MSSVNLMSLIVCPLGRAALRRESEFLVCTRCGPKFSIKDEIPNMMIEEMILPEGCDTQKQLECMRQRDAP